MTHYEIVSLLFVFLGSMNPIFRTINQAQGRTGYGGTKQDWGTVEVRSGAHMFWWLYYANPPGQSNDFDIYSKPLVIWLQGGPGLASSGLGNFIEIGPIDLEGNPRNTTWVHDYNVLFIDAPVGAGFSYTESTDGFNTQDSQIATDVIFCLRNFLRIFPTFQTVPTYIVGQSYGGRTAANIAWKLSQHRDLLPINLKGIALGSPGISTLDSFLSWASYAFNLGLVDDIGRDAIQSASQLMKRATMEERWQDAYNHSCLTLQKMYEYTGQFNFNNVLLRWKPDLQYDPELLKLSIFMNNKVKPALGIRNDFVVQSDEVYEALSNEFMKSAISTVKALLNHTSLKIALYTGQLDMIIPVPGTVAWVNKLFKHDGEWRKKRRTPLVVNGITEGYQKHYGRFSMYWINRAGHFAPVDNPAALKSVLKNLTG